MDQPPEDSSEIAGTPGRPGMVRIGLTLAFAAVVLWSFVMMRDRILPGSSDAKTLKQGSLRERRKAARGLAGVAARGYDRAAASLARAILEDTDAIVRTEAARSLGLATDALLKDGDDSAALPAALGALVKGLDDLDPNVRENSAHAVGMFARWEPISPDALARLAATDPEPEVRAAAAGAIGRFKTASPESVRLLFRGMEQGPGPTQRGCSNTLGQINPTKESVPDLIARLDDPRPEIRCRAADLLARLGETSADAVPGLIANLAVPVPPKPSRPQDSYAGFDPASFGANALGRIAPGTRHAKAAVDAIRRNLREAEIVRVEAAAQALVPFGAEAAPAVPELVATMARLLDAPHGGEGAAAVAGALAELAPSSPHADAAVAVLIKALKSKSEFARARSANALVRFGAKALPALPAIEDLQRDGSLAVRFEAARAYSVLAPLKPM